MRFYYKLVILILILSSATSTSSQSLPNLGSPDLAIYDRKAETQLGRAFTKALHSQFDLIEDSEVLSYIRRIGHHLASHTLDDRRFRFYVINHPSINAFAGPDGIIGIHSGLILAAETEDEIAAVIAHEIAHVSQQHLSRRFEQQSQQNLTHFAGLLAAILIGTIDPSAGVATLMGSTGLSLQQQLKYSRIHEHEADHLGIDLLHKAGYNPNAMSDFFGKLAKQYQLHEFRPPEILLTHPVTETRLAQAMARAAQLDSTTPPHPPLTLNLVQARLSTTTNSLIKPDLADIIQCYRNAVHTQQHNHLDCLASAIDQHPNNRLLKTQNLKIQLTRSPQQAIKGLEDLRALYPQDEAILLILAEAYISNNLPQQAQAALEQGIPNVIYRFALYKKLSQLYFEQHRHAEAYYYEALAQLDISQLDRAQYFIQLSLENPTPKEPNLAKSVVSLNKQLNDEQYQQLNTRP